MVILCHKQLFAIIESAEEGTCSRKNVALNECLKLVVSYIDSSTFMFPGRASRGKQ